jgi:hypothetical protein
MKRQLIWALALVFATFGVASAQETTSGSLTGDVVDNQGAAVPGATVTITSAQGSRSVVTDSNGRFFAPFLTPGSYGVKVELAGFSPVEQKNIQVRLGQRLSLNFTLKVGDITETIEVVGSAPVVDVNSTTAGGVLDADQLKRLPVGRALADTLYLVPGVSDSGPGGGRANPSVSGGSSLDNQYVVDGVNITDMGFGGAGNYNATFGSLGVGVTSDFIKETQVKTAGFEAEFGQSTGGVVNVVTRSGGNNFSGAVYGYFRPSGLEAEWKQATSPNGTVNTSSRNEYDFGVSLGGPLVKDKVFFFGTFNPQFQNRGFTAPEGFPYASLGEVERKRKIYSYAGKLTWQANSNHRFDISLFGDPSTGEDGPQRAAALRRIAYPGAPGTTAIEGGFSELDYGAHNQTLRYDGILSTNWLIEASVSHVSSKFNEIPTTDDWVYTDLTHVPQGTSGGLGSYERDNGKNYQLSLKSTNIFNAGGNHQVRYGVEYQDIEFTRDFDYTGPGVTVADGRQTVTGVPAEIRIGGGQVFYRATRGKFTPVAPSDQKFLSLFIQDTWQIGKLTLRPGIRWERQHLTGSEPGTNNLPALCFEGDSRPGAGDGSGEGKACEFTWDDNFAPRLGATFDIKGDGKSKIYASWGKFYSKIPNDLAVRAMSAEPGITRQNFRDPGLTQPVSNGTLAFGSTTHLLTTSGSAAIIDPESGSSYIQEFTGGVEFEVFRNVSLGARYIHRSMPQVLEDIGQLATVGYLLDVCGDTTVDYFITNVSSSTPTVDCGGAVPSFEEDPTHTYDAFEVTINKNFSDNWGLIASYRYSKLKGMFEGFYRSDNGQTDPSISSLFDFPTNDNTYTGIGVPDFGFRGDIRFLGLTQGEGILPLDRPHQLKVYGNYTFSNLNLGLGFNYGSGQSLTGWVGNPIYASAGEIPLTLRGEGIQTIDGNLDRAADDFQVDLHADYTFKLGERQRLVFLADAFNLFNRQEALNYDNFFERTTGVINPNFGQPQAYGNQSTTSFQAPFSVRFGARFEW